MSENTRVAMLRTTGPRSSSETRRLVRWSQPLLGRMEGEARDEAEGEGKNTGGGGLPRDCALLQALFPLWHLFCLAFCFAFAFLKWGR